MTNRFVSPNQQFYDELGNPYAGGKLWFYATGTSTPQNTYSDQALTTPNSNPVILDSAGYAGSIFLANLAYKVVLLDENDVQIWSEDPVSTSDYSAYARIQPYNGNPNGFVAGTAGTVGTLPGTSAVWDYINNLLYICTTTGTAGAAVWTAVNSSSSTNITPTPQGYLTASSDSSNPVPASDLVSQTAIYYTPFTGNQIPVYNGSSFVTTSFTQLSLSLVASHAASTLYDCFVFSNSGVLTLVTGPAWNNSTAGSGARGSGASTTQLQRLSGLWVNAVQITGRNGATTYTIPANTATYVGTISIDSAAGQVTCHRSFGQSRKFGVWNAYNQQPIYLMAGDSTASWSYSTATTRPSNNNTANSLQILVGLPEIYADLRFSQYVGGSLGNGQTISPIIAIGYNSTTTFTQKTGTMSSANSTGATYTLNATLYAAAKVIPGIGINTVTSLENGTVSGATITWQGTASSMMLSADWIG